MRYFFVILLFLLSIEGAYAASNLYILRDIAAESDGENAVAARENAVALAEKDAFGKLITKIVPVSSQKSVQELSNEEISSLVQSMEVQQEKVSPNHYSAVVSVTFNPDFVKNKLDALNVDYIKERAKPILIIPVFHNDDRDILWESANPWQEQWKLVNNKGDFVKFVTPEGNPDEIQMIDTATAISHQYDSSAKENFRKLAEKYGSDKIIIAEAQYFPDTNIVKVVTTTADDNQQSDTMSISGNENEELSSILARAVSAICNDTESKWLQSGTNSESGKVKLSITVPISSLAEWNSLRNKLTNLDFIDEVNIRDISVRQADLDLYFHTSYDSLVQLLAAEGIEVENTGTNILLRSN